MWIMLIMCEKRSVYAYTIHSEMAHVLNVDEFNIGPRLCMDEWMDKYEVAYPLGTWINTSCIACCLSGTT